MSRNETRSKEQQWLSTTIRDTRSGSVIPSDCGSSCAHCENYRQKFIHQVNAVRQFGQHFYFDVYTLFLSPLITDLFSLA